MARTTGVELLAEHTLDWWHLTPYVSVALMRREFRYGTGVDTTDAGTPRLAGRIGVSRPWSLGAADGTVDVYLRGESHVRLRDETGEVTDENAGYGTINARVDAQIDKNWRLVAELNNLADRSYTPYDQMPGAERSINLFVTRDF